MEKLPAIAGAIGGGLAAVTCVGVITGAVTWGEFVGGLVALIILIGALIVISEG